MEGIEAAKVLQDFGLVAMGALLNQHFLQDC
jgi:hypothetical protein